MKKLFFYILIVLSISMVKKINAQKSVELVSKGEFSIEALEDTTRIIKGKFFDKDNISRYFYELNQVDFFSKRNGLATQKVILDVYKRIKASTLFEMFASITHNLSEIAMTQDQIVRFCEKYSDFVYRKGHGVFFLSKTNSTDNGPRFYVVCVYLHYGDPDGGGDYKRKYISALELGSDFLFSDEYKYYPYCNIVIPKN